MSEGRFLSYMKLNKESEYHEMSHVEKRKKDRAFGRFIKSAMKQMKDWKAGTEQYFTVRRRGRAVFEKYHLVVSVCILRIFKSKPAAAEI